MIRRRVTVSGRVQGVFFRDTVRRLALEHAVAGWVANADDGSVEAAFEGPAAAVEHLVEFCRRGPERAAVEGIEVREEDPQGESGFRVM